MLRRFLLLLLLIVSVGPVTHADGVEAPRLLVLGDSLSAGYGIDRATGWVELLRARLEEEGYPHRVVNASISGDTSRGGRERLPKLLERHRPTVVVIELGGNDGLRGIGAEELTANLAAMVETARGAGARILLVGMRLPPNYGPTFTERFHAVYQEVADAHGTARVPFLLEGVALRAEWMQPDGLHPRAEGQPTMLENIWPELQPLLTK